MYYCNWWDSNPQTWQLLDCESNISATWLFGTMIWHLHYDIIYNLMCFINIFKNLGFIEIRSRVAGFRVQSANHYTIEPLWPQHFYMSINETTVMKCVYTGNVGFTSKKQQIRKKQCKNKYVANNLHLIFHLFSRWTIVLVIRSVFKS